MNEINGWDNDRFWAEPKEDIFDALSKREFGCLMAFMVFFAGLIVTCCIIGMLALRAA